ncbi:MAG TPA: biotin--[acetyl-CoA-carboxylase] ligase [Candidatus Limnocylindrales bacterium]|nr:biotin--[acetyl-CoA-carboxylase] ligase [Candidatus Limnocylindrales bacterium]
MNERPSVTSAVAPFVARLERFGSVPSTQPIVRAWLAEVPDLLDPRPRVAIAVADEQTEGRGRRGRSWQAPPGAALLLSVGFRPIDLPLRHAWRLAASVALAMLDAAESQGLRDGTLRLKWPNDLVADGPDGAPRKLAGVLGEVEADETGQVRSAIVGVGINADWSPNDFPTDLAASMTSLRALARRPVDRDALLADFLARLEPRALALSAGRFDVGGWSSRQRTNGAWVEVDVGDARLEGLAVGVGPETGGLLIEVGGPGGPLREIDSGEVVRCRLRPATSGRPSPPAAGR